MLSDTLTGVALFDGVATPCQFPPILVKLAPPLDVALSPLVQDVRETKQSILANNIAVEVAADAAADEAMVRLSLVHSLTYTFVWIDAKVEVKLRVRAEWVA